MTHPCGEERRQALKRIALQLACQDGYDRTSIRRIAEVCGVTVGLIYHHFENKQALFKEAILERSFIPRLEELLPRIRQMPVEEGLVEICRAFLRLLNQNPEISTILAGESLRNPEIKGIFAELNRKIRESLTGYVREKIVAEELIAVNPELVVQMIHGHLITNFLYQKQMKLDLLPLTEEEMIQGSVQILLYGIKKGEKPR